MTAGATIHVEEVIVHTEQADLQADLTMPEHARALILFAHGSGSGRLSTRNRAVASVLHEGQFGTLLLDLLTGQEQQLDNRTAELRFNISLLAGRLVGAIDWCAQGARTAGLRVGLYGASTGAAAALIAAAQRPQRVGAVVSRGGRADMAGPSLPAVTAPTLLIVGGNDPVVLDMNIEAAKLLRAPHQLQIVSGAGHLFEERGKLEQVAQMTLEWFERHLK